MKKSIISLSIAFILMGCGAHIDGWKTEGNVNGSEEITIAEGGSIS
ncbi:MAG: hypothetical protein Q4D33_03400 [Prevotellaceae bacterium]|nr:hypothetical protein [Prevotellaceae bacterium]